MDSSVEVDLPSRSPKPPFLAQDSIDDEEKIVGNLTLNTTLNGKSKSRKANSPNGDVNLHNNPSATSHESYDEEDYGLLELDPRTVIRGGRRGVLKDEPTLDIPQSITLNTQYEGILESDSSHQSSAEGSSSDHGHRERRQSFSIRLKKSRENGRYTLKADDPELREILRKGLEREAEEKGVKRRAMFGDLVFTRQFTAFDRQNTESSPFRGFYTLFWLGTFLMLVKIAASNWKVHGNIFGRNEILSMMFHRDVIVLGLTDGFMCASTVFCLLLQRTILAGYLSWNRHGWIIQNIWQSLYLAATISWTIHRDWPWTHTLFLVLHCLAMLMKQHSYAFYNGHLSETLRQKNSLEKKLQQLKDFDLATSPTTPSSPTAFATSYLDQNDMNSIHRRRTSMHSKSSPLREDSDLANVAAAIESEAPLDFDQICCFERIIKEEIDGLNEELRGKCSVSNNFYPLNLNIRDFAGYIPLPTLVYELEYPRQESINWSYVVEKTTATFGVLGVMNIISQAYIYPVVIACLEMKDQGIPLPQRLQEFPWVLSDLIFPIMMEYLLAWYVIWECILNVLAELTLFADRGFYADWWNSTSWDKFARDWNRPVHAFLLRHVYHSSISALRLSRPSATLATFLLSACVHELVMWCIFKKLRGYLMMMQMMQLPLVGLSRLKWMKGRDVLGNLVFWVGIFTGPSFLCSLYLII